MPLPSYGGKVVMCVAQEATAGLYVASTAVVPQKPIWPKKNPQRKPLEVALGTAFADMFVYDGEGLIEFSTEGPIFPTISDVLLSLTGLTGTLYNGTYTPGGGPGTWVLGDPQPTSVTMNIAGDTSAQVAGCYVDTIELSGKANQPVTSKLAWKGMVDPVFAAAITPVVTAGRGFQWRDQSPYTTLGNSTVKDVDDITMTVKNNLILHRGNVGSSNPSHIMPGKRETSIKFTKLHLNLLDFNKFVAAATTGAFGWGFANSTPKSYAFALTGVAYTDGDFDLDLAQPTREAYTGYCETPTGVSPLTTTVV